MQRQALTVLLLAASSSALLNGTVSNGELALSTGVRVPINNTFSSLGAALFQYYAPLPPPTSPMPSFVNSTLLSYLELRGGAWLADAPLALLAGVVLVLRGTSASPAAGFPPTRAMIEVNYSAWSGVVSPGGDAFFSCPDPLVSPGVVWAVGSPRVVVDGLRVFGCGHGHGAALHVQGTPGAWGPTHEGATIANNNITNSSRAVWLETVRGVSVHRNAITACSSHALDFDALCVFARHAAQHIARAYRCAHKHTRALTSARITKTQHLLLGGHKQHDLAQRGAGGRVY